MNFINRLFRKRRNNFDPIDREFSSWVNKSIILAGTKGKDLDNEKLVELFVANGIPQTDAVEIVLFLPVAFCRKLLPQIKWHDHYVDFYSERKQVKRLYKDNPRFVVMQTDTDEYWSAIPDNEIILNIAGRSAEFKTINELLLGGGRLENIEVGENFVVRYN